MASVSYEVGILKTVKDEKVACMKKARRRDHVYTYWYVGRNRLVGSGADSGLTNWWVSWEKLAKKGGTLNFLREPIER